MPYHAITIGYHVSSSSLYTHNNGREEYNDHSITAYNSFTCSTCIIYKRLLRSKPLNTEIVSPLLKGHLE